MRMKKNNEEKGSLWFVITVFIIGAIVITSIPTIIKTIQNIFF